MAFLDNSGDIILDAVLTDTGRFRLARGDGTFRIAKFALADDEINYELYRNENHILGAHPDGSAHYALEILQTPILEAFTNNTSLMKSRLVSIPRTNLLYLPVLKLNTSADGALKLNATNDQAKGMYFVAVDLDTTAESGISDFLGYIHGHDSGEPSTNTIRVDQGLDTSEISADFALDADLIETQYIIEIDNRLGFIRNAARAPATPSFIDDDNIASYYFAMGVNADYVNNNAAREDDVNQAINGPRGTILNFTIAASLDLRSSTYLFTKLGSTGLSIATVTGTYSRIDTNIRVTGLTTGYRIDIPVRFLKKD
ncbi:MAG: hypothetical protein CMI54_01870 [Parcubacteria group bacterium]|nr:hypothetical protein [Parcubacteria group bacterium]